MILLEFHNRIIEDTLTRALIINQYAPYQTPFSALFFVPLLLVMLRTCSSHSSLLFGSSSISVPRADCVSVLGDVFNYNPIADLSHPHIPPPINVSHSLEPI